MKVELNSPTQLTELSARIDFLIPELIIALNEHLADAKTPSEEE